MRYVDKDNITIIKVVADNITEWVNSDVKLSRTADQRTNSLEELANWGTTQSYWTGGEYGIDDSQNCNNWTSSSSADNGTSGEPQYSDYGRMAESEDLCNRELGLLFAAWNAVEEG